MQGIEPRMIYLTCLQLYWISMSLIQCKNATCGELKKLELLWMHLLKGNEIIVWIKIDEWKKHLRANPHHSICCCLPCRWLAQWSANEWKFIVNGLQNYNSLKQIQLCMHKRITKQLVSNKKNQKSSVLPKSLWKYDF
jgi:hypothetical protein